LPAFGKHPAVLVVVAASVLFAAPFSAAADQAGKLRRLGVLTGYSREESFPVDGLRRRAPAIAAAEGG